MDCFLWGVGGPRPVSGGTSVPRATVVPTVLSFLRLLVALERQGPVHAAGRRSDHTHAQTAHVLQTARTGRKKAFVSGFAPDDSPFRRGPRYWLIQRRYNTMHATELRPAGACRGDVAVW